MPPLTWNADRRALANGRLETTFGVKWRNYLSDSGWAAIDLTPRQVSTDWVFDKAPYSLTLPSLANGWATFESTNKYDIHSKTPMADAKCGIQKRYSSAVAVTGVPEAGGVRFPLAFPSLNAHRLVQTHQQKVRDLIVFTSAPPGSGPVEVPIEIDFGGLPILESTGHGRPPTQADMRSDKDIAHGLTFTTGTPIRGIKVKEPWAWDSAGRRTPIKFRGRVVGTRFIGSKVISRSVFVNAVYPVYADTTSTFYPDPNTESTSVDGYAARSGVVEAWATIRAGNGVSASDSIGTGFASASKDPIGGILWESINRFLMVFDTSSIDDAGTVTDAVLSIMPISPYDFGSQSISICPGTTASSTAIAASDYQSNTSSTVYDSNLVSGLSADVYSDFQLDAAGIALVSRTGVTKYCAKISGDVTNTEPAEVGGSCGMSLYTADTATTAKDPKLVVTWTPAPAVSGGLLTLGVG